MRDDRRQERRVIRERGRRRLPIPTTASQRSRVEPGPLHLVHYSDRRPEVASTRAKKCGISWRIARFSKPVLWDAKLGLRRGLVIAQLAALPVALPDVWPSMALLLAPTSTATDEPTFRFAVLTVESLQERFCPRR